MQWFPKPNVPKLYDVPVKQFHVICCYTDKVYALVSDNALHAVQRCSQTISGRNYTVQNQTLWGDYGVTIGDYYCFYDGRNPKEIK